MKNRTSLIRLLTVLCLTFSASTYAGTSLNILNQTGTQININALTLQFSKK